MCSKCGGPRETKQRYCRACKAAYERVRRPKYSELSPEEKAKSKCRSHTKMLIKRGLLEKKPCQECGATAEAHHSDYSNPRLVTWLCRQHHKEWHRQHGAVPPPECSTTHIRERRPRAGPNRHFFRPDQVREIADRMRKFRHLAGLTQRQLGLAMGLGKWGDRQVRMIENREHVPWAQTFERFLAVEAKHERESEDAG